MEKRSLRHTPISHCRSAAWLQFLSLILIRSAVSISAQCLFSVLGKVFAVLADSPDKFLVFIDANKIIHSVTTPSQILVWIL